MAILATGVITKTEASGAPFHWGPSIGVSAAHSLHANQTFQLKKSYGKV